MRSISLLQRHQKIENVGAVDIEGVTMEQGRDNSKLTKIVV